MSIIAFKLTGDYAHFSHPATIYSSLTYPIPPKTAIMGLLAAIIAEEHYYKLSPIRYSIKLNTPIIKKSFIFNGIKFALRSNPYLKKGYQDSNNKKQFYRELICSPSYTVFVDLSKLNEYYQHKIISYLKAHKCSFTPYLGINFCIANFEWVEIRKCEKIDENPTYIDTFTLKEDFVFEEDVYDIKLTTTNMACGVEEGRIFKEFKEFVLEIGGKKIKSKNRGNIYQINENRVYFV